jgi:acyl-CoA dehydrogenase
VIALDVLRCMRNEQAHLTIARCYTARLEALGEPAVKAAAGDLVVRWRELGAQGEQLLAAEPFVQQAGMTAYVDDLCHTVMATLLLEQAQRELVAGLGARKLLLAHTALHRLVTGRLVVPVALTALDAIADGGHVDTTLAQEAYDAIPAVRQEEARA